MFSETAWIFPKQGQDSYKTTLERNLLFDTVWYKSQVFLTREDDSKDVHSCSSSEVFGGIMNGNNSIASDVEVSNHRQDCSSSSSNDSKDDIGECTNIKAENKHYIDADIENNSVEIYN